MRVFLMLLLALHFCLLRARTSHKAMPSRLEVGGSKSVHCATWLKLVTLGPSRETKGKPEVVFNLVGADERSFDSSEFRLCPLKSSVVVFGDHNREGQLLDKQAVRLVAASSTSLQIILSDELKQIPRDDRTYLLLTLSCGDQSRPRFVCVQFPDVQEISPQYVNRHLLGVKLQEDELKDGVKPTAMIAMLMSVAGIMILIIALALCADCAEEEGEPPSPKLLSLNQTAVDAQSQNAVEAGIANLPTVTVHVTHEKDENNVKQEVLHTQELHVNACLELKEQRQAANLGDVTPGGLTHDDVTLDDVTPTVNVEPANPDDGNEQETRVAVKGVRKTWYRSRSKEDHPSNPVDATKPDEEHKEKKPKKQKKSFMKGKRSTLERTEGLTLSEDAPSSLPVAERPRAPTPTSTSMSHPEHHPRELPPPPVLVSRIPRERQLSAPGALAEDDQYEVVRFDDNRPASTTEAENSFEAVTIRARDSHDSAIDRPVSIDSTYDVIGEGPSDRPTSELYEVVDIEGRLGAVAKEDEEEENDTYEVVGDVEKNDILSSSDAYEEVKTDSTNGGKIVEIEITVKEEQNEGEKVDPKYAKVGQQIDRKSVGDDNPNPPGAQLTVDVDESVGKGVDPKYAKVRKHIDRISVEDHDDPKYSRVHHRAKKKADENAEARGEASSASTVVSPGDQTYEEVNEASKNQRARPPLLKHASTPELPCSDHSDDSAPPPAPSLHHLKEITEAGRPRAFTEGGHTKEGLAQDDEPVFDYQYAQVDRTKKTSVSGMAVVKEGGEDADDASDDEPPPLPPIYVSLSNTDGEGTGGEDTGEQQEADVRPQSGLYDEVIPSPTARTPPGSAPPYSPGGRTDLVDSDYETVEEMMKYPLSNGAAGKRSSLGQYEAIGDIQQAQSTISDHSTTESNPVNADNSTPPGGNIIMAAPQEEPHYEPVEVRKNGL